LLDEATNGGPGWTALVEDIAGVNDQVDAAVIENVIDDRAIGVLNIDGTQIAIVGIRAEERAVAKVRIGQEGADMFGPGFACWTTPARLAHPYGV
jgi:hypothetical protein